MSNSVCKACLFFSLLIQSIGVVGADEPATPNNEFATICCLSDPPARFKSVRLGFSARNNCVPLSFVDRAEYSVVDHEVCKSAEKAEPYITKSFDPNEDCSEVIFKRACERRNRERQQAQNIVCCKTSRMGRSWFYFANAWTCEEMDGGDAAEEALCTDDKNPRNSRLDPERGA